MTTQQSGPIGWVLPMPTPDAALKRSRELAHEFFGLFVAFGAAANGLAASGDRLGFVCFVAAARHVLEDAAGQLPGTTGDTDDLLK